MDKDLRKGIKTHIFKLDEQEAINKCLAEVRLSEHGVQIVPGTFFAPGRMIIFENLLPLEEEDIELGATPEELLGPIGKTWTTGQDMLLKLDSVLAYMLERKGKGSKNTQFTWEKDFKARTKAREETLSKMAMAKREAELIVSGRYPTLNLTKDGAKSFAKTFELPELTDVEEDVIFQNPPTQVEGRKGS